MKFPWWTPLLNRQYKCKRPYQLKQSTPQYLKKHLSNSFFVKTGNTTTLLNNSFTQILMVSSTGTSASKNSISNDAIDKLPFCFQTILENSKESFKVNSLETRCYDKGTNHFHHL